MTDRVEAAIAAIARGGMIVVTDDDDRENEGDLVCAAVHCDAAQMSFIIRHGCGIVCTPVSAAIAQRLHLAPMVDRNDAPLGTAFTVSVDLIQGMTTGIAARERAATARALADPQARAGDFARPGHVFPLIARDGGVLSRTGHTEAAVDLCRLAGLPEAGVICELVNDDGTVMAGRQVADFAARHGLPMISVGELVAWRQRNECLVRRVGRSRVESVIGPIEVIEYESPFAPGRHLALRTGATPGSAPLTCIRHADPIADLVGRPLCRALEALRGAASGLLIRLDTQPAVTAAAGGAEAARQALWEGPGLAAQILRDLGADVIQPLLTDADLIAGLGGFGIAAAAYQDAA